MDSPRLPWGRWSAVFAFVAVVALGCSSAPPDASVRAEDPSATRIASEAAPAPAPAPADLLDRLRAIAGVTAVTESPSTLMGTRYFVITFEQPVDHRAPRGAHFSQTLTLLYRSPDAPTVMGTAGYFIKTDKISLNEPAYALQANQLVVEHRYYGSSTPQPTDWKYLNIYQSASDHHRVYQAFRPLMPKRWAATGGSKSGMAALYYRFFYPRDMAATLPYVSPATHGLADPVYDRFLAKVGTAECRDKIHVLQRTLLAHRAEIQKRMLAAAAAAMDSYDILGTDRTLDFAVLEAPFTFWQYVGSSGCADLPAADATDDVLYQWLSDLSGGMVDGWGDKGTLEFAPFYYESATELGWPGVGDGDLVGLLHSSGAEDRPEIFPPNGVEKPFNPFIMPMTEQWVREQGHHFLFVFGGNDPWSARKYRIKPGSDNLLYVVADGTHLSKIADLPDAEQKEALAKLSCWMGAPTIPLPKPMPMPFGAAATTFSAEEIARGANLIEAERPPVRRAIP